MMKIFLLFLCLLWTLVSSEIVPTPHYRTPKNIAFSSHGGGSSHHIWVMEILKEMNHRGHNVSFFSRGDQLRFANGYPVKTRQVGGTTDFLRHPLILDLLSTHPDHTVISMGAMEACMMNYPTEFFELQNLFQSEKIDLVICDSFAISCIDTAIVSKIPVMITSTFGLFADDDATYINNKLYSEASPTTQDESMWARIYRDYISVPRIMRTLSKRLAHVHAFQRQLGLTPTFDASTDRYNHVPKMVNNVFGIEVARRHSPLVHMIGPIIKASYPSLDAISSEFLNRHKKVAYIAFGQHASPSDKDVKMLMQTLLRLLDEGHIDGILWARLDVQQLPPSMEISSHPDILLMDWAPQFAILEHPSTAFFLTHGGVGSLHEALFNAVRLFVYPFFGDQPTNARAIERVGVGKYMDLSNPTFDDSFYKTFYQKLAQVAADPNHTLQTNVDRYSAYVQVAASNAVKRSADLMEESLFASDDQGRLYYRNDVGYEIHWLKRNNLDVYAVFAVLAMALYKLVNLGLLEWKRHFLTGQKVKVT